MKRGYVTRPTKKVIIVINVDNTPNELSPLNIVLQLINFINLLFSLVLIFFKNFLIFILSCPNSNPFINKEKNKLIEINTINTIKAN